MGPEARVPCPSCGGPIHPIAGRCKHCRTDLAALRAGNPQAPSPLPSLGNRTINDAPVAGPRARVALPPVDPSTVTFSMSSPLPFANQVLPPRESGRMPIAPGAPSWPLIVIALSAISIVLSIGALAF